jgi:hypothetical protein
VIYRAGVRIRPDDFAIDREGRASVRYHYRYLRGAGVGRVMAHATIRSMLQVGYATGVGARQTPYPGYAVTITS